MRSRLTSDRTVTIALTESLGIIAYPSGPIDDYSEIRRLPHDPRCHRPDPQVLERDTKTSDEILERLAGYLNRILGSGH
jgi:hypothetical protein